MTTIVVNDTQTTISVSAAPTNVTAVAGIISVVRYDNPTVPVVSDYIEIPRELIQAQQDVILCMDTMQINGLYFLTTVSRNIMDRTTEWVPNKTAKAYRSALDNVFRVYNMAGFKIKSIHCDNEYRSLMQELESIYEVKMNYASAQEHVPEIERTNRRICVHKLNLFGAVPN